MYARKAFAVWSSFYYSTPTSATSERRNVENRPATSTSVVQCCLTALSSATVLINFLSTSPRTIDGHSERFRIDDSSLDNDGSSQHSIRFMGNSQMPR